MFIKSDNTLSSTAYSSLVFNYGNAGTYDYFYVSGSGDTNAAYIPLSSWDYNTLWVQIYSTPLYASCHVEGTVCSKSGRGGLVSVSGYSLSIPYSNITTIDLIQQPNKTGNVAKPGTIMRLYGCTYGIK